MFAIPPRSRGRLVLALSLLAGAAAPAWSVAAGAERPDPCAVTGVERVVAVGDVHGAYDRFVAILKAAGLLNAKGRWSGGRAHLVQTGDVVDRGPDSRKALDLLRRLEGEAARAGGRVHALLGNHEVMWMLGDLRYTTPGEYASFRTGSSEEVRERVYQAAAEEARGRAKAEGQRFDEKSFRERFLAEVPLGLIELRTALGPNGEYGVWLRSHAAMAKIDGVVFLHGGVSPTVAPLGCKAVNETVGGEIAAGLEAIQTAPTTALASRPDGPLWYRGLVQEDEASFGPQLDEILRQLGARALVVGHTVVAGRIAPRFGGRVFPIDTGMQAAYMPDGRASALEIRDGAFTAVYVDGREPLRVDSKP